MILYRSNINEDDPRIKEFMRLINIHGNKLNVVKELSNKCNKSKNSLVHSAKQLKEHL